VSRPFVQTSIRECERCAVELNVRQSRGYKWKCRVIVVLRASEYHVQVYSIPKQTSPVQNGLDVRRTMNSQKRRTKTLSRHWWKRCASVILRWTSWWSLLGSTVFQHYCLTAFFRQDTFDLVTGKRGATCSS
jgi:hypothetical protein